MENYTLKYTRPLTDCRPTALKLEDSFRGSVPGKCLWKEKKECRFIEAPSGSLIITAANRSEKKKESPGEPLFTLSLLLLCSGLFSGFQSCHAPSLIHLIEPSSRLGLNQLKSLHPSSR